jgi:hypothetical protein
MTNARFSYANVMKTLAAHNIETISDFIDQNSKPFTAHFAKQNISADPDDVHPKVLYKQIILFYEQRAQEPEATKKATSSYSPRV